MRFALAPFVIATILLGCNDDPTSPTPSLVEYRPATLAITIGSRTLIDLGSLGGAYSYGFGVTAAGDVAGYSALANGYTRAVVWSATGGAPLELTTLGGDYSSAFGINDAGTVVGYSYTTLNASQHAALWPAGGGAPRDLGTLGGAWSYAYDINTNGDIVGYSQLASGNYRATLWPAGGGEPRDLGTAGQDLSAALRINDAGSAVGYSYMGTGFYHATLWPAGGTPRDLGTLGGRYSQAYGINAAGDVVGYSELPDAQYHATLWPSDGGAPRDLGTLGGNSAAHGINDAGDVVGYSYVAGSNAFHATLWPADGSGPIDLGTLGGTNSYAWEINSSGHISGYSDTPTGQQRATVWRPVAQPQSISFTSTPPNPALVGDSYIVTAAGGGSGNPVTFTSLTPAICALSGNAVSFTAASVCEIAADQAGNDSYLAAPRVTQTLEVTTRPLADAGPAQSGSEGSTITFDASGSSDPDGDALTSYAWDFGDGTTQTVSTPTVQHVYDDNKSGGGPYEVTLRVTDARGATSLVASTSALIQNIAPTATFAPPSSVAEGILAVALTAAQDANGDLATLQYAFDCGDGTGYRPFSSSPSAECSLADNGVWNLRAKVQDKDGALSEYSRSVSATNVAPAITLLSAPSSGKVGVDYVLQFKFSDPGTRDAPWWYQITWGDGKKGTGLNAATTQGLAITHQYRYASPGTYTITVRVTDKNGGTATSSATVTVVR